LSETRPLKKPSAGASIPEEPSSGADEERRRPGPWKEYYTREMGAKMKKEKTKSSSQFILSY